MTNHHQVLMTADKAAEMGCTPLAKIVGYADGATDPIDFPIAPKFALDKLMAQVLLSAKYMNIEQCLNRLGWPLEMSTCGRSMKLLQL